MTEPDRKLFAKHLRGAEMRCEACRDHPMMSATGWLYHYDLDPPGDWMIEFHCPSSGGPVQAWARKFERQIRKAVAKQPSVPVERSTLSPFWGWLFTSKPQAITIRDEGLVVERGTGTTLIAWDEIESLIADTYETMMKESGRIVAKGSVFELRYGGGHWIRLGARDAAAHGPSLAAAIVKRAHLEWVDVALGTRKLPSMALPPADAARLRASLPDPRRSK
jgi:hypothetical protein